MVLTIAVVAHIASRCARLARHVNGRTVLVEEAQSGLAVVRPVVASLPLGAQPGTVRVALGVEGGAVATARDFAGARVVSADAFWTVL